MSEHSLRIDALRTTSKGLALYIAELTNLRYLTGLYRQRPATYWLRTTG